MQQIYLLLGKLFVVPLKPEEKYRHNIFQKQTVKTTKPITLPPFSTTIVHGHTKLKSHGVKLNLIAEPFKDSQLPSSVQCTPTYCNLEPVPIGLQWELEMFQLGKLQYHLGQLYFKYNWPIWYPLFRLKKNRPQQKNKKEDESCILEQLDLGK